MGERQLEGPEMIQVTSEKVRIVIENLKVAQDRQKSYADVKRRPLTFEVGEYVFLKTSPMKGVVRFGKRGKLNPRFVGPFEIIGKVGEVSYQLSLPPEFPNVHDVFHVSMLRRYLRDPDRDLLADSPMTLQSNLSFEVRPIEIMDRKEKVLRNKVIPLVKVWWPNQRGGEATWEKEVEMRKHYPELFENQGNQV